MANTLSMIAGIVIQLLFRYAPKIRDWYAGLGHEPKRWFMVGLVSIVAVIIFSLSCLGAGDIFGWEVVCDSSGFLQMIEAVVAAVGANQLAYFIVKKL